MIVKLQTSRRFISSSNNQEQCQGIFWILDAVHRDNIWSWADISPGTEPAKPHFLDGRPDPASAWDLNHNLLLVQTQLGLPDHYHTTDHSDSSFHKKALVIPPTNRYILFERYIICEPWVALQAAGWIAEPSCHCVAVGCSLLTLLTLSVLAVLRPPGRDHY